MFDVMRPTTALAAVCAAATVVLAVPAAAADEVTVSTAVVPAARRNPIVVPDGPWRATDLEAASGEPERIRAAIAAYRTTGNLSDGEVLWRLSKAYFHLYDELPRQYKSERVAAAEAAAAMGEQAVVAAAQNMHAKYWYSQGLLALGDMKGAVTFLSKVKEIKALATEVLAAAPDVDDAGPDRFFAIYYHELPWPFKDDDASFAHAEQAYRRAGYRCANVYLYARGLVDRERRGDARPLVDELVTRSCTASSAMWSEIYQGYGRELEGRM